MGGGRGACLQCASVYGPRLGDYFLALQQCMVVVAVQSTDVG